MSRLKQLNNRSVWITTLEVVFLLFLLCYGYKMHLDNVVRPVSVDENQRILQETEFGIDSISKPWTQSQEYLSISGWFVERYADLKKHREHVTVLLKDNTTGTYYRLPTTMNKRTDITDNFYDGTDYSRCGFSVHVKDDVVINLQQQDYELYIYARTKSGSQLIDLGTGINQWITDHQQN